METNEIFNLIDADFLEKVYRFSYRRCNTSHEAEELCSMILLRLTESLRRTAAVENFYGFVWTVARRAYADFSEKRRAMRGIVSLDDAEPFLAAEDDAIEALIEDDAASEELRKILHELTFLSKTYRDVMVMYYLDEMKVKDIAARLEIKETTVKQRLFSARNEIRKEVSVMKERTLSLKPVRFIMYGTGDPIGNDPREKAERTLSQNLIYACKDRPKTAKELSEELCVPMPYIEEELDIQVRGENGEYGMLRRLENGKYATNVLLVDSDEYDEAIKIFERHMPEVSRAVKASVEAHRDALLGFPYLSRQDDTRFVLWTMTGWMFDDFMSDIVELVKARHFADVVTPNRPFSTVAIAFQGDEEPRSGFYGCDGIGATDICGYAGVHLSNLYGTRIRASFRCGHDIAHDAALHMLLRSIGGLPVAQLTEDEKEVAAKAIECGYIRKNGDTLEPKVVVMDGENAEDFWTLANSLVENLGDIKECIADALADHMKRRIPAHLLGEYPYYIKLIAGSSVIDNVIEACIEMDVLRDPAGERGGEGILLFVKK